MFVDHLRTDGRVRTLGLIGLGSVWLPGHDSLALSITGLAFAFAIASERRIGFDMPSPDPRVRASGDELVESVFTRDSPRLFRRRRRAIDAPVGSEP